MTTKHYTKFLSALICLLFALNASAEQVESGNFVYETTSESTVTLIGLKNNNLYDLVIPDSISVDDKKYEVNRIGSSAFAKNELIESAKMGNHILAIGDSAFYFCKLIKSVTLSKNITSIGKEAFTYCSQLESMVLPENLVTIDSAAFAGCSGLATITLSNGVTTIASHAFSGTAITRITIPSSVETIGSEVFIYTQLDSITIPSTVKVMDTSRNPFFGCKNLKKINVEAGSAILQSDDNILFSKDKKRLITWPMAKIDSAYTVPNGTVTIGSYAFYNCVQPTSVVLPEGVTTVEESAFDGSGITSIILPESLTNMGRRAFAGSDLRSVVVPNKVTTLNEYVFNNTPLTDITLGKSVTTIHPNAFYCYYLEKMNVLAQTPPVSPQTGGNDLERTLRNATLYVPTGTYDAYYATYPWREAAKIIETDGPLHFLPVSSTLTPGGYLSGISFTTKSDGQTYHNITSVMEGDTIILKVYDASPHNPRLPTGVFLNGVDITRENESTDYRTFTYTVKVDKALHFDISYVPPVGNESVDAAQTVVYGTSQNIIVHVAENNVPVFIYDMRGRLVHQLRLQEGTTHIPTQAGLYIIKLPHTATKVIVQK